MRSIALLTAVLFFSSCTQNFMSMREDKRQSQIIDELRLELADVKHDLHSTKVELQLLDEKHRNQESLLSSAKNQKGFKSDSLGVQLTNLERKLSQIEKGLEKTNADLKQLATHAAQTNTALTQYRDRIQTIEGRVEEVVKLKATLHSISQAIQKKPAASETYKVKSGDSLDKIAKAHHLSTEQLKKINGLDSDKIVIGQEIKLHE